MPRFFTMRFFFFFCQKRNVELMRSTRILHSLGIEMKETRKEEKEEERGVNPLLYFLPLFSYFLFSHPHTERERER